MACSVLVAVPDVDRSKTDPRNLLGVVLAVEDGLYRIGTREGVLEHLYSRNQIEACASNFLLPSDVPTTTTSLRNSALNPYPENRDMFTVIALADVIRRNASAFSWSASVIAAATIAPTARINKYF